MDVVAVLAFAAAGAFNAPHEATCEAEQLKCELEQAKDQLKKQDELIHALSDALRAKESECVELAKTSQELSDKLSNENTIMS